MDDISDEGPEPAPEWRDAQNNLCGSVRVRDAAVVAKRFVRAGWRSRSSSSHGYEVETSWCMVELDPLGKGGVLMNGVIDPGRLDLLATLLTRLGMSFTLELYDENDRLLREVSA
ncbi:hypothetical protein [Streptomyces qinzhouensis]|uniref:Uncharacterized protein n=1 Tax=Streptomyces qinzhouensis TaxID=2599401 RepID=A0A5B8IDZ8_9ACTN|nr:hypothetical protein [Streptomyces qinzhouensis]QDY75329.1 hypothetical protein FQU76_01125 [Streptomyces qinzhouensis]